MSDTMTSRHRWLAAVRGEPLDRLPFWPKIFGAYLTAQGSALGAKDLDALHAYVGSDRHEGLPYGLREVRTCTSHSARKASDGRQVTVYETPVGRAELHQLWDADSQSWHPVKFPVEALADIRTMTAYYRDCRWELDAGQLGKARERKAALGESAVTTVSVGESPFMHWIEYVAGVANAHYLLADHPEAVLELLDAMHAEMLRRTELLAAEHPADLFYMMENTSSTLLSPDQYRLYNRPHLRQYVEVLNAAGKHAVLHMCGKLKAVLPLLSEVPAVAFEAFTSPPVGDTTLADGRRACPRTCLIGGTNAVLWTRPPAQITLELERHLAELPHHRGLVITSAGVMPPLATPQAIREVCQWVQAYPARW